MDTSEKTKYRFALVLLAEDLSSAKTYFNQHKPLLTQKELQGIFIERSSESGVRQAEDDELTSSENISYYTVPSGFRVDDAYNASLEWIRAETALC